MSREPLLPKRPIKGGETLLSVGQLARRLSWRVAKIADSEPPAPRRLAVETRPDGTLDASRIEPDASQQRRLVAMIDERIGQTELQDRGLHALLVEQLRHGAAGAAHDGGLFERHQ